MNNKLIIILVVLATSFHLIPQSSNCCTPGRTSYRRGRIRRLTPLVRYQFYPDQGELTPGASGHLDGQIRRHDRRFKELVENKNPDIVFKNEDGKGADRMMTKRLKEKLSILGISVMNTWPDVKLRVIRGWKEGSVDPAKPSLHYEGRAVDITTSDKDTTKYGLLARLAVESGCDWVHYESRAFVHCSVRSEKSDLKNNGCFDGDATVQTPEGQVNMSQLQTNDLVLTMNPANGQLQYSPIILWLDRDEARQEVFVELETKSKLRIRLTSSHLIYVSDEPYDLSEVFAQSNSHTNRGNEDYNPISKTTYTTQLYLNQTSNSTLSSSNNNNNHRTRAHEQEQPIMTTTSSEVLDVKPLSTLTKYLFNYDTTKPSKYSMYDFTEIIYARNAVVGEYVLVNVPQNRVKQRAHKRYERGGDSPNDKLSYDVDVEPEEENVEYHISNEVHPTTTTTTNRGGSRHRKSRLNSTRKLISNKQPPRYVMFDEIVKITFPTKDGIYAPLTREGNIVVDGVVASCYAMISDHDMAHMAFLPVRLFSYLNEFLFGLKPQVPLRQRTVQESARTQKSLQRYDYSSNTNTNNNTKLKESAADCKNNNSSDCTTTRSSTTRNIHWYPAMLYKIGRCILPTRYLY